VIDASSGSNSMTRKAGLFDSLLMTVLEQHYGWVMSGIHVGIDKQFRGCIT